MSRKREDIRVPEYADRLNLTVDQLESLWGKYIESYDTDRQPNEYTQTEFAEAWGVPRGTIYERLRRMTEVGLITRREGRVAGRRTVLYKLPSDDGEGD
jgi:DNA-binding MarR family transcriptional regulator